MTVVANVSMSVLWASKMVLVQDTSVLRELWGKREIYWCGMKIIWGKIVSGKGEGVAPAYTRWSKKSERLIKLH
jgi:hypothetical protein